jgi:ferritin-like metal-binding protein YciE
MATSVEQNPLSNAKLLQYLNEMLSIENAAIERLQTRVQETTLPESKQQLQHHLEETIGQQERIRSAIINRGGTPTIAKAELPIMNPKTETTARVDEMVESSTTKDNDEKETIKSFVSETKNVAMKAEKELIGANQDAVIENAEIISYNMLIDIAKKINAEETVLVLEENLRQEETMAAWIMANAPKMLDNLWRYIESSAGPRTVNS